jgi:diguanylate cyclase (GGDEF)-like protein/PAS domain S-box-containing protein
MFSGIGSGSLRDGFKRSENCYFQVDRACRIVSTNAQAGALLAAHGMGDGVVEFEMVLARVFGPDALAKFRKLRNCPAPMFNVTCNTPDDGQGFDLLCINEADEAGDRSGSHIIIYTNARQFVAEAELVSLRSIFRDAFDNSAVCMAIVAPGGEFMQVNDAFCEMLQYSREELLSGGFQALTHPHDLDLDLGELNKLLEGTADHYTIEKRYIAKDGSIVWGILSVSVARDADRQVRYFISQVQDITDRKSAEAELQREAERAMVTLRSIGDAVITCDHKAVITYINPVAEALTGWGCEEATGLHISEVFAVRNGEGNSAACPVQQALHFNGTVLLEENCSLVRRNGELLPVEDSAAPIRDNDGQIIGAVLVFHDVSERRAMSSRLDFLAHHDALTSLPNRVLFKDRAEMALANARRSGQRCAMLFCDLDRFKRINDAHGHMAGDEVLKAVADRLRRSVRQGDTICRWAGDEFAMLLPAIDSAEAASVVAQRVLDRSDEVIANGSDGADITCGMSIGISIFPDDGEHVDELIAAADMALYSAKAVRNAFKFQHGDFNKELRRRVAMEREIRSALLEDRFIAFYQPRICTRTQRVVAAEALCRLNVGDSIVLPGQFIDVAEAAGLIDDITLVMFDAVCRDLQHWGRTIPTPPFVSFNISPISLRKRAICEALIARCHYYNVNHALIEMEITEGALLEADESISTNIALLHEAGFRIALDDFGTGFSNLSYLQQFPVDTIKIDKMFIHAAGTDAPLMGGIAALGRSLNINVVAEGVETAEQRAHVESAGCDEAQGYFYARPMPGEAFSACFEACLPSA